MLSILKQKFIFAFWKQRETQLMHELATESTERAELLIAGGHNVN